MRRVMGDSCLKLDILLSALGVGISRMKHHTYICQLQAWHILHYMQKSQYIWKDKFHDESFRHHTSGVVHREKNDVRHNLSSKSSFPKV
jgi:hypothetical protein